MSAGWSKRRDIDPLADGQTRFEFEIPVGELARLAPRLAPGQSAVVTGDVQFSRDRGLVVAEVEAHAQVPLVCQRCLQRLDWPVNSRSRVVLVGTEPEADEVAPGMDTVLATDRRISLRELVEEELLLEVPAVPLHPRVEDCAVVQPPQDAAAEPPNVQRPFERLGELLKRER